MGVLGRLFGGKGKAQPPALAVVRRAGAEVMRVGDTFVISGRGLTVTGELLLPVRVDEKLDVLHDGKERPLRVTGMLIDKEQVESAVPGTKVALMLSKWQLPTI